MEAKDSVIITVALEMINHSHDGLKLAHSHADRTDTTNPSSIWSMRQPFMQSSIGSGHGN
jgi:hypothetical protein